MTSTNKALLLMDLQHGILGMANVPDTVVAQASKAAEHARKLGIPVIHVGLGFLPGYPEFGEHLMDRPMWAQVKQAGKFIIGQPETQHHPDTYKEGELMIWKQRVGAFYQNQLELILRKWGVTKLILAGVATSGIVLTTVRDAFDRDFSMTVLEDACWDRDEETHRLLMEKVIPKQAAVVKVDDFLATS